MRTEMFLQNKIQRQLVQNGRLFDFYTVTENEYKEVVVGTSKVSIVGLYHESNSYQSKNTQEGSVTTTKASPMILCMLDAESKKISFGDRVVYGTKTFKVIDKNDVQDFGIAYDISLEEV